MLVGLCLKVHGHKEHLKSSGGCCLKNFKSVQLLESDGQRSMLERLSVAIQHGNAASVLGTVGGESRYTKLDAVYYLE